MPITDRQILDQADLLESDIHTLFKLVFTHRSPVTNGNIGAASAILRKWVCEGLINQHCNAIGASPTFPVLDNQAVLDALPNETSVTYFLTGGVKFNGLPFSGIYHSTASGEHGPVLPLNSMPQILVNAGKFARQKRIFFDGNYFSCAEGAWRRRGVSVLRRADGATG